MEVPFSIITRVGAYFTNVFSKNWGSSWDVSQRGESLLQGHQYWGDHHNFTLTKFYDVYQSMLYLKHYATPKSRSYICLHFRPKDCWRCLHVPGSGRSEVYEDIIKQISNFYSHRCLKLTAWTPRRYFIHTFGFGYSGGARHHLWYFSVIVCRAYTCTASIQFEDKSITPIYRTILFKVWTGPCKSNKESNHDKAINKKSSLLTFFFFKKWLASSY